MDHGGRLMDRVRAALRVRHYSARTEEAYTAWIRRFIVFHGRRHPVEIESPELSALLLHLADRGVSASTQNQALAAVLFLYRHVLGRPLAAPSGIVRARRPVRLPVVLSRGEVAALLSSFSGPVWLAASFMYGGGLRLLETMELRVKDVHPDRGEIVVRDGKGGKDRVTILPAVVRASLSAHLVEVKRQHDADLAAGRGAVALPDALAAKHPHAEKAWGWQWVFPATRCYRDRQTGEVRRHRLHETVVQRAVTSAARAVGLTRPATCHTLRHHADSRIMPSTRSTGAVCSAPDDALSLVRSA